MEILIQKYQISQNSYYYLYLWTANVYSKKTKWLVYLTKNLFTTNKPNFIIKFNFKAYYSLIW